MVALASLHPRIRDNLIPTLEDHQRVILLTNYATAQVRERAMALGADAVFDKSTEISELLEFAQRMIPHAD